MRTHTQARGFAVKRGGTVQYLTELYMASVSKRFTFLFPKKKKKSFRVASALQGEF